MRASSANNLRVAIPDAADALETVKVEIEGVTGFAVQPVFQEIEGSDLLVELRLVDSNAANPGRIARSVERSARRLDVLSTWKEAPRGHGPGLASSECVFDAGAASMPDVARRAVRDGLATAKWVSAPGNEAKGDSPHWMLAVPLIRRSAPSLVGVRRRRGYSYRFGTHDAAAMRRGLAS
jgi:hypothetical protein